MRLTQRDYEERQARLADGTSPDPDDDRRLVKHYERQGFALGAQPVDEPAEQEPEPKPRNNRRGNLKSL
jgi:hypothetical protein